MVEDDNDGFRVTIRLSGTPLSQEICGMLRGLLYVNGNSNGQLKKDAEFKRGVTIEFGTPPMALKFVNDVNALFHPHVRGRLNIKQHS